MPKNAAMMAIRTTMSTVLVLVGVGSIDVPPLVAGPRAGNAADGGVASITREAYRHFVPVF